MKLTITIILCLIYLTIFAQTDYKKIIISDNIELIKISDNSYIHVSYSEMPPFGRVSSNGLLFIDNKKAFLFDTPVTDALTKDLVTWIQDSMKVKIVGFVPNHWHSDCMGGLKYLQSLGIKSYANEKTIQIANLKNLPIPENSFKDSLILKLNDKEIVCRYPGAAHTVDNIVVWIPSEKILFAGCMVKDLNTNNLGNTADGDVNEYPRTITKVLNWYSDAKIVVPGHGKFGDVSLLKHTLELSKK